MVLRDCFVGPPDVPSLAALRKIGVFVSPILYGGLGNVLFQLAAVHVHAENEGVRPLFAKQLPVLTAINPTGTLYRRFLRSLE